MSHTLEQTRKKMPMWHFEHNYRFLREIFPELIDLDSGILIYRDQFIRVEVKCLEISRYTTLISLNLIFIQSRHIPSIKMSIRLYHDANVADVVTYQNISRLVAPYFSTEKATDKDHKSQANNLLYELLSGCMKKRTLAIA